MKVVLGILVALAAIALCVFVFLYRMAVALYPITHRKMYDIPPDEEPVATGTKESSDDNTPSLFETVVEESRKKS